MGGGEPHREQGNPWWGREPHKGGGRPGLVEGKQGWTLPSQEPKTPPQNVAAPESTELPPGMGNPKGGNPQDAAGTPRTQQGPLG